MLIVIFAVLSLIHCSLSARTCKKSLDFTHVKNIERFEKQDHPACLKGHFQVIFRKEFDSYLDWLQINEKVKLAQRQPEAWKDFESISGIFMGSQGKHGVEQALKSLDQLTSQRKAKLSAWLRSQKKLMVEIRGKNISKALSFELRRVFPFIF